MTSGQFLTLKIVFHLIFQFIIVFSSGWYCIFCQRPLSSCYECAPDRETRFLRIQEIMMRHNGTSVSNFKRPNCHFHIFYSFSFLLFSCFSSSILYFTCVLVFICSCFHLLIFILSLLLLIIFLFIGLIFLFFQFSLFQLCPAFLLLFISWKKYQLHDCRVLTIVPTHWFPDISPSIKWRSFSETVFICWQHWFFVP